MCGLVFLLLVPPHDRNGGTTAIGARAMGFIIAILERLSGRGPVTHAAVLPRGASECAHPVGYSRL